ncbi:hypothetical protein HY640_01665 [Candidatus Woesearchaeota archaeon]|nr:hypothetical protein [Candidatus Woesearchaeota archaeon]
MLKLLTVSALVTTVALYAATYAPPIETKIPIKSEPGVNTTAFYEALSTFDGRESTNITEIRVFCKYIPDPKGKFPYLAGRYYPSHTYYELRRTITGIIDLYGGCEPDRNPQSFKDTIDHELKHHGCYRDTRKDCDGILYGEKHWIPEYHYLITMNKK